MGYLSDAEKASISADYKVAMDTFMRPLSVYQEATHTVIVSDPNYNPYTAYNQNVTDILNTPTLNLCSGRIMWDKQQEWKFLRPQGLSNSDVAQVKTKGQVTQAVRLKVDASGYALLATAKKVQIDGVMLDRESEPRPHGIFSPDAWTFYFVRSA